MALSTASLVHATTTYGCWSDSGWHFHEDCLEAATTLIMLQTGTDEFKAGSCTSQFKATGDGYAISTINLLVSLCSGTRTVRTGISTTTATSTRICRGTLDGSVRSATTWATPDSKLTILPAVQKCHTAECANGSSKKTSPSSPTLRMQQSTLAAASTRAPQISASLRSSAARMSRSVALPSCTR